MNSEMFGCAIVIVAQPSLREKKPAAVGLPMTWHGGAESGSSGGPAAAGVLGFPGFARIGQTASAVSGSSTASLSVRSTTSARSPKSRAAVSTVFRIRVLTRSERTFLAISMACSA